MTLSRIIFTYFLVAVSFCTQSFAAQSTADVPVTDELRLAAREKVLGVSSVTPSEEEYVIGHGDVLSIQVYGEGEMSAAGPTSVSKEQQTDDSLRLGASSGVTVRIDGRISLKHIGDVEAVAMTPTQLADYLKEIYSAVFENPIITVVLLQSNSQRYTVMGKVVKPGVYYLDYPINLVQVVARSGGFTEWTKSEITLVRNDFKNKKSSPSLPGNTLTFDYREFLDGKKLENNVPVQSGDIVIVN